MIDVSIIKTSLAIAAAVVGIVGKGPDALKTIRRWKSDRHRAKVASIMRKMKVLKSYQENPVILVAEGKKDMLMCGMLFLGFMLTAVVAVFPSKNGWDATASLMLAGESLSMLAGAIYLFERHASRLNGARNPHRTMILHEINIMRLRLDRAEFDIRRRTDPILESDLHALRSLDAKLPGWRRES
ncbi:hypothetical protein [Burkholderia pseudomallei]|uniref:hypothetical protein n=1 Tax=Burkholderia pseudomallei TaxID=28450 RepID=UPI000A5CCC42|nr:hypothetical protein [Burkholderia pseudomallei]MBF3684330.1 hypothetical protein [Burkholderia pseudomallei]MBF3825647.1 hypothetical protein [Burkholderia pseudomallei]MBF3943076.1 hypothetical protein [Burkholderia pseudomallei]MBF4120205.1 hypothetical protein [Burkholderia pseudomallei]MCD4553926.1 hypothetical protein [Burkholderia pseudomallei]